MDPLLIAVIVAVFTLIVLFSGIPIAFGLSFVSIALLVAFESPQMILKELSIQNSNQKQLEFLKKARVK